MMEHLHILGERLRVT